MRPLPPPNSRRVCQSRSPRSSCSQVQYSVMIHTGDTILCSILPRMFGDLQRSLGACVCVCVGCHVVLIPGSVLVQRVQREFSADSLFMHFCFPNDGIMEPLLSEKVRVLEFTQLCFFIFLFLFMYALSGA